MSIRAISLFPRVQKLIDSAVGKILFERAKQSYRLRKLWCENIEFFQRATVQEIENDPQLLQSLKNVEIQLIQIAQEYQNIKPVHYIFSDDPNSEQIQEQIEYYNPQTYKNEQEEFHKKYFCDLEFFNNCMKEEKTPKPIDHSGSYGYERIIEIEKKESEKLKHILDKEMEIKSFLDQEFEDKLIHDYDLIKKKQSQFNSVFEATKYPGNDTQPFCSSIKQLKSLRKGQRQIEIEKNSNNKKKQETNNQGDKIIEKLIPNEIIIEQQQQQALINQN